MLREAASLKRGRRLRRTGFAEAALAVGVVGSGCIALGTGALNSLRYHYHYSRVSCLSNVKEIGLAIAMYAEDYDEHFVPVATWNDAIQPYVKNRQLLHCPEVDDVEKRATYGVNRNLKGLRIGTVASPATTITLFDSVPGDNLSGTFQLVSDPPRHNGGENFGFLDGHAKWYRAAEVRALGWTPEIAIKLSPKHMK